MTLVAGFMTLLDVSIVSVALPSIQQGLGAGPAEVQWVVSGYALTFGLSLVPAGRLGDALGRCRMFLLALGGFVLCSALAGAAPTVQTLIAARLAQGLAAGALAPQNSALIQHLFRGAERGRAFGRFGATVGVSTAVGPVAGGGSWPSRTGPTAGGGSSSSTSRSARSRCCWPPGCSRAAAVGGAETSTRSVWRCSAAGCWPCCCHWCGPSPVGSCGCGGCSRWPRC